jgi:hypothetical protein
VPAKDSIIEHLTKLNDKLQAKLYAMEKAARSDAPKADPKEVRALKEVADTATERLKRRDADCKLHQCSI